MCADILASDMDGIINCGCGDFVSKMKNFSTRHFLWMSKKRQHLSRGHGVNLGCCIRFR